MSILDTKKKKKSFLDSIAPVQPLVRTQTLGSTPSRLNSSAFSSMMPSLSVGGSTPQTSSFDTGKSTLAFLQGSGQSSQRGFAALGSLTGNPITPTGQFQEELYGTTPEYNLNQAQNVQKMSIAPGTKAYEEALKPKPITLSSFGREITDMFPNSDSRAAPAVGLVLAGLDLVGGGGLRGIKGLTQAVKVADTAEKVSPLLRKAGFSDDIIVDYAPKLAKLTDEKQIEKGLLNAQKLQNSTKTAPYQGETDLSTKLLEKLKGRTTVSRQFIEDLTNSPDLKQPERDLIRNMLSNEGKDVSVPDFANKVKSELLPLRRQTEPGTRYENITLPDELRGHVAGYGEHIYQSPIKTSAGEVHFAPGDADSYFAHTRIEDLPDKTTRRVIEAQSDLFQKGRLEQEKLDVLSKELDEAGRTSNVELIESLEAQAKIEQDKLSKLEPYRNTWHERVIREEVKQAAKDGKTKLQFPTGETALRIEQLGMPGVWTELNGAQLGKIITPESTKVGMEVAQQGMGTRWVITQKLDGGRFKAVQKNQLLSDMKYRFKDIPEDDIMKYIKTCL